MNLGRLSALIDREVLEIWRDPQRLAAAFAVPAFLLLLFGFGLTLDVEHLTYATLDRDNSPQSRAYLESWAHSRFFDYLGPARSDAELERRFAGGEVRLGIEIPSGFGRDLLAGRTPQVLIQIDGTKPFHAETARGYAEAMHLAYLGRLVRENLGAQRSLLPAEVRTRYWYNQTLESRFALVPGLIAAILLVSPAMLIAAAVVREKEFGSITNLYATPVTRLEFLIGKQIPYAGISLVNVVILTLLAVFVFGVPVRGSIVALFAGAVLYVLSANAIGLLISSFTRSQLTALIVTLIVTLTPAFLYSGLLTPVSSLTGEARYVAYAFPAMYFLNIAVGSFTKGLGIAQLLPNYLALAGLCALLIGVSAWLLPKQGR